MTSRRIPRAAAGAAAPLQTARLQTARLRTARLRTALLLTLLLTALTSLTGAAPAFAAAEPVGHCTTTSGVIVAVDFAHWGGPVLRSCGSTPTTGYTLLNQGGWHTSGTEHDGPGFICRIGYSGYDGGAQFPTPAQEPCVLTPPATAYWAFWYANPGQNTWSYSQTGATSIAAQPGSVELWIFGGTTTGGASGSAVPTISPASLRAHNTSSAGTVKHPASHPASTGSSASSTPASPAAAPGKTTPAPGGSSKATPAATVRNAQPAADSHPASHGSATPAIIALVIVLAVAAVGLTAVLRRPRRER